jgi:pilus assembly protein CpaE
VQSENLTISLLLGTGVQRPEIQQVLENLPQLKLVEQTCDPKHYCMRHQGAWPDMILVELDGESTIPPWLEKLPQDLPKTPVLLCSHNREPEFLIRAMQVGIREFLPLPLNLADLEAAVSRVWQARRRIHLGQEVEGKVIVVTGHKGGSGSTTVAVNLAVALAELTTNNLALVDLGRPFPDVGNFLNLDPTYTIRDLAENLAELDQDFLQRIMQPSGTNLFLLHGIQDFREQENLNLEAISKIFKLLRSLYRYIVVDLSHWLDEFFLQVVMEADLVLLLTGLTIPDLRNLKRMWPSLLEWYPERRKFKLVVNRFDRVNGLQLKDLEQLLQQNVFATLPSDDSDMMETLNRGAPLGVTAPRCQLWKGIKALAEQVQRELPGESEQQPVPEATAKRKFWIFRER